MCLTVPFTVVECGGNYTDGSGLISSPSYPEEYPRLSDCTYLIAQPSGLLVNVSINDVDMSCHKYSGWSDFIEFRDGDSESSPLMVRFCGGDSIVPVPAFMTTTGNYLRVR